VEKLTYELRDSITQNEYLNTKQLQCYDHNNNNNNIINNQYYLK